MSSISYAITSHNEGENIKTLVGVILENIDEHDEIVILDDVSTDTRTIDILSKYEFVTQRKFKNNFAEHKNFLNTLCSKDYIFQIDGDELPTVQLINFIKALLRARSDIDLCWIPRENKLTNLNLDYIHRLGWNVDSNSRINYPDYQGRVYKNQPHINWHRSVHEIITGHKTQLVLPKNANVDIIHHRDMEHQVRSNNFYNENFK
jgi:glycosyltransferase involved in cell wall biosynthesis